MAITSYCTVANIETWLPSGTLTTSTKISTTDVLDLIERYSASIDNRLSDVYVTPFTTEYALSEVKNICVYMTLADVNEILGIGLGKRGEKEKRTDYRKLAEDMLKAIESGSVELGDATKNNASDFNSYNYNNDIKPVIKKDATQW